METMLSLLRIQIAVWRKVLTRVVVVLFDGDEFICGDKLFDFCTNLKSASCLIERYAEKKMPFLLKLVFYEISIKSILREQLLMSSGFGDVSFLKHKNLVRVHDGRQSMRDQNASFPVSNAFQ